MGHVVNLMIRQFEKLQFGIVAFVLIFLHGVILTVGFLRTRDCSHWVSSTRLFYIAVLKAYRFAANAIVK